MRRRIEALAARIDALPTPRLLAFDVDGTLAPVVPDPSAARVPAAVGAALHTLSQRPDTRVALVTGRDAAALSRMVPTAGLHRVLEHGAVTLLPSERARTGGSGRRMDPRLAELARWAKKHVVPAGGLVEPKANGLGIHVRELAGRDPRAARAVLRAAAERIEALGLHPRPGRAVLEAQIEPASKARALEALLPRIGVRGLAYFGDDLTDLPALRLAVRLGGIGVFVRSAERPRTPRGLSGSLAGPQEVGALVLFLASRVV